MGDIGFYAIWLGGALAAYSMIASFAGGRMGRPHWVESARNGVYAQAGVTCIAVLCIEVGLLTDDFSLNAVAATSSRSLPLFYKVTSFWGGQAGSLLFWAWILSMYSAVALYSNRNRNREIIPYVITTLSATSAFFFILLTFFDNPFSRILPVPVDGRGLNPVLQDPGMAFHPPNLYLGYVGWTVPFCLRHRGPSDGPPGGRMDPIHAPLVAHCLVLPGNRQSFGVLVGLSRTGLGRILGLGSGRERSHPPVDHRDGLPPLGHDSGKEGNAEGLEPGPCDHDLHADDFWHVHRAKRCHLQRARFCTIVAGLLLFGVPGAGDRVQSGSFVLAAGQTAVPESIGVHAFPGERLSAQ